MHLATITMTDLHSVRTRSVAETLRSLLTNVSHVEKVEPGCGEGDNYMALVYRVLVRFEKSNEPSWLFVKVRPKPEDERIEWMSFKIAFENECEAYNHLKVLGLPMASCYRVTPETIVLEDLVIKGYSIADKFQGFDLVQSLFVLENLAKFHGNSIRLRSEDTSSFNTLCSKFQIITFNKEFLPRTNPLFDKAIESIDDQEVRTMLKEYQDGTMAIIKVDEFLNLNRRKAEHALLGIIHGDCWINNVMIREENALNQEDPVLQEGGKERGAGKDLKFVDFQSIDINSILVDLITFLVSSVDLQVLIDHYQHMIIHYHKHLNLPDLSFERFLNELEPYRRYFLLMFVFRGLTTTSTTQDMYDKNLNMFIQFLRKHEFL